MSTGTLNIGLIGAGRIGRLHAENLVTRISSARLRMIADVNEDSARLCAQQLGVPGVASDYRAVLENRDIQAVLICSATDTHAEMIEAAAQAGKHIFCEKPTALDLAAIDRALALWPNKRAWRQLMRNGMSQDWGWTNSAKKYVEAYERLEKM